MILLSVGPMLQGPVVPGSSDVFGFFYEVGLELRNAYTSGQLPFWNPFALAGAPLLADPGAAALYPPNILLYWLLPVNDAMRGTFVLHMLIAYVGMYGFLRSIRLNKRASVYGAVAYAFGGYMFFRLLLIPELMIAALLPVVFWCAEVSLRGAGWARVLGAVGLACAVSTDILVGFPQGTYYTLLALAAFIVCTSLDRCAVTKSSRFLRHGRIVMAWAVLPVLIGIGLCSVQLLPALEFVRATNLADAYGPGPTNAGLLRTDLWALVGAGPLNEMRSLYTGALGLAAASAVILVRRDRYTLFFLFMCLVVPLLSTQHPTPVRQLASLTIPGWTSFADHVPTRALVLTVFGMAVLAALALDRVTRALLMGIAVIAVLEGAVILLVPMLPGVPPDVAPPGPDASSGLRHVGLFLAIGLASLAVWEFPVFARSRSLRVPCMTALLCVDLLLHQQQLPWGLPLTYLSLPDTFAPSATAAYLHQTTEPFRFVTISKDNGFANGYVRNDTVSTLISSGSGAVYSLQDAQGYNPLQLRRYNDFLRAINGTISVDYHFGLVMNPLSPLLRYLNVRFLVVDDSASLADQETGAVQLSDSQPSVARTGDGETVDSLEIISTLSNAASVPQGMPVGALDVLKPDGTSVRLLVRAGIDTADAQFDNEAELGLVRHERASVARSWSSGLNYESHSYRSVLQLPGPTSVAGIRFELLAPGVNWAVERVDTGVDTWSLTHKLVYQAPGVRILERQDVLPRVFLAQAVEQAPDGAAALARISDPAFDARQRVVVEQGPAPADAGLGQPLTSGEAWDPGAVGRSDSGRAEVASYQPDDMLIDVQTPQPEMLVVTDQYFPAWRAYVDGRPATLYRADYMLRAVAVPPGEHAVQLRYDSDMFKLGAGISCMALLLLLGAATLLWRQRRFADGLPGSAGTLDQ